MARSPEEKADLIAFGQRVREVRLARGWTQEDLAEKASMDRTYVGGIERGERNLAFLSIRRLALALSSSVEFVPRCIEHRRM